MRLEGEGHRDDPSILSGDRLLRLLPPHWVIFDTNQRRYRASSQAFGADELSVYIESLLASAGLTFAETIDQEGWSGATITAGEARAESFVVLRKDDPLAFPHPRNVAHGLVVGKKKRTIRERLAALSVLVVEGNLSKAQRK